jgi:hypothetical protein
MAANQKLRRENRHLVPQAIGYFLQGKSLHPLLKSTTFPCTKRYFVDFLKSGLIFGAGKPT